VADGPHTVYAQWQDSVGHWSGVSSATITVDRTAPTVTSPSITLTTGTQLGTTTVPVTATWSTSDIGLGVVDETVEASRGGSEWALLPRAGAISSPTQLDLDFVTSWRIRVTARDAAGNLSSPVESAPFSASVTQDVSKLVVYSGRWVKVNRSTASGGTIRYSKAKGATAKLTFTGRAVAWVAPTGPNLGKARVLINGRRVATVDLRGDGTQRLLVFSRTWVKAAQRTIKIKVLGTAGRPRVELDGFVVLT
jgi:hypothetical protein